VDREIQPADSDCGVGRQSNIRQITVTVRYPAPQGWFRTYQYRRWFRGTLEAEVKEGEAMRSIDQKVRCFILVELLIAVTLA